MRFGVTKIFFQLPGLTTSEQMVSVLGGFVFVFFKHPQHEEVLAPGIEPPPQQHHEPLQ